MPADGAEVAAGCENALRLRVFGTEASIAFDQEQPNELWFTPLRGAAQKLTRGGADSAVARHATRVPAGHPEGYLEAFAQVYSDAAELILARIEGRSADALALDVATVEDGVAGHRFIDAVLQSHSRGAAWVPLASV